MMDGKLKNSLMKHFLGQKFVVDPTKTVKQHIAEAKKI